MGFRVEDSGSRANVRWCEGWGFARGVEKLTELDLVRVLGFRVVWFRVED